LFLNVSLVSRAEFDGDKSTFPIVCTYQNCTKSAEHFITFIAKDSVQGTQTEAFFVCLAHTMNIMALIAGTYKEYSGPGSASFIDGAVVETDTGGKNNGEQEL